MGYGLAGGTDLQWARTCRGYGLVLILIIIDLGKTDMLFGDVNYLKMKKKRENILGE